MTDQDDIRWARRLLTNADPVNDLHLADLARDLRVEVRDRTAVKKVPDAGGTVPVLRRRTADRGWARASSRSPWPAAIAAVLSLVVGYAGLAAALPDPAWAVDQTSEGLVRVELSPVLGRGPDVGRLVEELEGVGVSVEVQEQDTWWLWESGRIIGLGTAIDSVPEAFADGQIEMDADLSDVGIIEHGDGSLVIDPDVFVGEVTIKVGDFRW